jgi:hypothetical protein
MFRSRKPGRRVTTIWTLLGCLLATSCSGGDTRSTDVCEALPPSDVVAAAFPDSRLVLLERPVLRPFGTSNAFGVLALCSERFRLMSPARDTAEVTVLATLFSDPGRLEEVWAKPAASGQLLPPDLSVAGANFARQTPFTLPAELELGAAATTTGKDPVGVPATINIEWRVSDTLLYIRSQGEGTLQDTLQDLEACTSIDGLIDLARATNDLTISRR